MKILKNNLFHRAARKLSGARRVAMLLTIILTATTAQTAWAGTVSFPTTSGGSGTSGDPYQIKTIDDLNKLATDVNSGTNYLNKYFKLMNDIDFNPTTTWNDATSTENNFTPIGGDGHKFSGHFDGNNKTIRGLRIYSENNHHQGLFGYLESNAVVEKVTLADARIAGGYNIGGIAGCNQGTVTDCHVHADVTIVAKNSRYGGIVGYNNGGTVSHCTSAVKIAVASGENPSALGGIVGLNASTGGNATLTDNFVIGAVIPTAKYNLHAAIASDDNYSANGHNVSYARNYYWNCTVAGTENASNVGIATYNGSSNSPISDVNTDDGAVSKPVYTLTLAAGITAEATPAITVSGTPYYRAGTAVTLSGRPTADGYIYPYLLNGTPLYVNTFTMPASNVTVTVGDPIADWQSQPDCDGLSEATAYQIRTTIDLDLLAQRVNSGTNYNGYYFKLMNDIAYAHTTAWNDVTSTENNYTAIGSRGHDFKGTFDGDGHTVSGIRIYKGGSDASSDSYQGLFGHVGGTVKNVTLTDARITGYQIVGGIVGNNKYSTSVGCYGTVTGCRVAGDVALHIVQKDAGRFGGIVGCNSKGTVSGCTSAVKITAASGITGFSYLGGIVGLNSCNKRNGTFEGTITGCHAVGANVAASGTSGSLVGDCVVENALDNPLNGSGNTYHSCLVGSNAFNIAAGNIDSSSSRLLQGDCDGATLDNTAFLLDDCMDAPALIAAYAAPVSHTANNGTRPNVSSLTATLSRTFPAGKKQTVCLPFPPNALLNLGTVWEFTGISDGKAVMTQRTSRLQAHTPYIFEATNDVTNPTFSGVSVTNNTDPKTVDATAGFTFHGTYTQKHWLATSDEVTQGTIYGFMMQDNDGQEVGQFVKARRRTVLRPFSCWLEYNGALDGTQNAAARSMTRGEGEMLPDVIDIVWLSAGSETTGIRPTPAPSLNGGEWYDLSGRRLSGKPTKKGLYIHNGNKVAIKD